jgi:hypothetical protein
MLATSTLIDTAHWVLLPVHNKTNSVYSSVVSSFKLCYLSLMIVMANMQTCPNME